MVTKTKATAKGLRGTKSQAETRLLLALWDLGGVKEAVKKTDLTKRTLLNHERVKDYDGIFAQLEEVEAIALKTEKRVVQVSLQEKGLQILDAGLKSPEFEVDGEKVKARDKDFNAVLRWFRGREIQNGAVSNFTMPGKAIASYDEFKPEALALFEKLDKSYNYSGLVPIWHLRRELKERVSPEEFNDWLMEMQAQQLFYLQSGEARGATDEQKRGSINDDVRGLLFFASQPS